MLRARRLTVALLLLLGAACGDDAAPQGHPGAEILPPPENGRMEHPELVGMPREAMLARFGPPGRTSTLRIGDGLPEEYLHLADHYSPTDPADADVRIRQDSWYWGDHTLNLWYHQVDGDWVVLETLHSTVEDVNY